MTDLADAFAPCRDCTCSAFRRASRAVTQHFEEQFSGSGLRSTQFTVLATLIQTGAISISRLARILGVERTTLTRNLGPLERRKLVTVLGDADGRVRKVGITRAGQVLAVDLLPRWKKAQASVGSVLSRFDLSSTRRR
jgi:DNA-binding MarR family transcriptional regulator